MSPWKAKKEDHSEVAAFRAIRNEPQVISRSEIMGVIRKTVSDVMTQQMSDFEHRLTILANANTEKLGYQIQCFQTSTYRLIENLEANIKQLQIYDDRLEKELAAQLDIAQENAKRNQEDSKQTLSDNLEIEIQATLNQEALKADTEEATDALAYRPKQLSRNPSSTSREERCKPVYSETTDAFRPKTHIERPQIINSQLKSRETKDYAQQTSTELQLVNQSSTSREERCKPVYSETTDAFRPKTHQERPQIINSQLKSRETKNYAQQTSTESQLVNQSSTSREERCLPIYSETTDAYAPKTYQERPQIINSQLKTPETKDYAQQTSTESQIVNQSPSLREERCLPIYSETTDAFRPKTHQERPQIINSQLKTRETKDYAQQTSIDSQPVNQSSTSREERCKPIYSETTDAFRPKTHQERPQFIKSQLKTRETNEFAQQMTTESQIVSQSLGSRQERCLPIYSETTDAFAPKPHQELPQIINSQLKSRETKDYTLQTSIDSQIVIQSPTPRKERYQPIFSQTTDAFAPKKYQERSQLINSQLKSRETKDFAQQMTIEPQLVNQSSTSREERCKPIYSETTDAFRPKTHQERPQIINSQLKTRETKDYAQQTSIDSQQVNQSSISREERCKPIYSETTDAFRPKTHQERPQIINSQLKTRETKDYAQQTSIDSQMVPHVTNGHAVPTAIHSQFKDHVTNNVAQQSTIELTKGHAASTIIHSHSKGHIVTDKSQSLCIENFYI